MHYAVVWQRWERILRLHMHMHMHMLNMCML